MTYTQLLKSGFGVFWGEYVTTERLTLGLAFPLEEIGCALGSVRHNCGDLGLHRLHLLLCRLLPFGGRQVGSRVLEGNADNLVVKRAYTGVHFVGAGILAANRIKMRHWLNLSHGCKSVVYIQPRRVENE